MHKPCERIIPGGRCAVLFIHGVMATPRFWDSLVASLPPDVSFVNLLLPGHGGTVKDFGRVRRGEWQRHVHDALLRLKETHPRVYLVGHSMGGLLSILEAAEEPEGIAGLLLMAPALRIRVTPAAAWENLLKGLGLGVNRAELATYYGTEPDWRFWRYIPWIPRYLELFALSRAAREALPRLTVPTRAFRHGRDELVSPKIGPLLAACPAVTLAELAGSRHHDVAAEDLQALQAALHAMCAEDGRQAP